jgi:hypothetical protein
MPVIAQQRARARSEACAGNLRQIGLGMLNYESAYKQLPPGTGGTLGGKTPESSNQGRLGPLVAILPYMEQQALWEKISIPFRSGNTVFPRMGPVPWYDAEVYKPWGLSPLVYQCPDHPDLKPTELPKVVYSLRSKRGSGTSTLTNYVACFGDGTNQIGQPFGQDRDSMLHSMATHRGVFIPGKRVRIRDCLDGLSNTIMFSETRSSVLGNAGEQANNDTGIVSGVAGLSQNPSLCLKAADADDIQWWSASRGSRWCDGEPALSGFQTVLPPNSPSCLSDRGLHDAIASASSYHEGGAFAMICDGSVTFVTETIDTGDLTTPGVSVGDGYSPPGSMSPYGVWGAYGTRASREVITKRLELIDVARSIQRRDENGMPTKHRWRSKAGDISLNASFVQIIDKESVQLKADNGVIHQVPLNTLNDSDIVMAVMMDLERRKKQARP